MAPKARSGDDNSAVGCCGCMVLVVLALAITQPVATGIIFAVLVLIGYLINASQEEQKRQALRKESHALRRNLGGGNVRLGADIEACQQRIAQLRTEEAELLNRLRTVRTAREKLAQSRLRSLAETYDRAEQILLTQHLEPRRQLIAEWEAYLRDLDAMAAAQQAESALDGLTDPFRYGNQLADERERLDRLTGELISLAEVEQMLRE